MMVVKYNNKNNKRSIIRQNHDGGAKTTTRRIGGVASSSSPSSLLLFIVCCCFLLLIDGSIGHRHHHHDHGVMVLVSAFAPPITPLPRSSSSSGTRRSRTMSSSSAPPPPPPLITTTTSSSSKMSSSSTSLLASSPLVGIAVSLSSALKSGPYGVLALSAIASLVLIPITQVKNMLGITLGYGLSVATIGLLLDSTFHPGIKRVSGIMTTCLIAYGIRLATYLYLRRVAGYNPSSVTKREDPARIKRVPFALSLAFFYAFMTCPVLYLLRAEPILTGSLPLLSVASLKRATSWIGAIMAVGGGILEAVADAHKFVIKLRLADEQNTDTKEFKGPTNGVYSFTRHPNYTGEVLFWFGVYISGVPCFGNSLVAWVSSTMGLYGIVSIMRAATSGLERRQQEKYGSQTKYQNWKLNVQSTLFPFITTSSGSSSKTTTTEEETATATTTDDENEKKALEIDDE